MVGGGKEAGVMVKMEMQVGVMAGKQERRLPFTVEKDIGVMGVCVEKVEGMEATVVLLLE